MAVYTLYSEAPKPATFAALQAKFPDNYKLSDTLLAFRAPSPGSAKDIILSLNTPDTERNSLLITQITADYWGYHSRPFWDWLQAAFRSDLG
jgi:hypothetical protein